MYSTKKRRKKLLFKKILPLKKNILNSDKFLKFKKQKWQKFKFFIKKYKKKKFYDFTSYPLYNFTYFFSKKFKYNLDNKQRLSFFYGNLRKTYLKMLTSSSLKNFKQTKTQAVLLLIEKLESRLDVALYRTKFATNINCARQLISHKKIYVNNKIVSNNSYLLKKGDFITFDSSVHNFVASNVLKFKPHQTFLRRYCINYKTLQLVIVENINYTNYSTICSFWLDFHSFLHFYRK